MIRKYTPRDRKKIKHLYRDATHLEPTFSCYLDKHYKPYVFVEKGKILGVIMLEQDYLNLFVFNLYVDMEHRGKRIGEKLIIFAEEYARKKKLHGVRVSTGEHNKNAQKFYRKTGFEIAGKVKNYHLNNNEKEIIFWKEVRGLRKK